MTKTEGFHAGEFLLSEGRFHFPRTGDPGRYREGPASRPGAGYRHGVGPIRALRRCGHRWHRSGGGDPVCAKPASPDPQAVTVIARLAEVIDVALTGLNDAARGDLKARNLIVRTGTPY